MNVLFFLTPKQDVAYLYSDSTLRQALEKMEYHRYSCIPLIDRDGTYAGTITEGDLLWDIKKRLPADTDDFDIVPISQVARRSDYKAVCVTTSIEELLDAALNENFVPVVDDRGVFIGIVTRKRIMQYYADKVDQREHRSNDRT
ncbi:MAG: CBS domain-containing protein [Oscillospiraceae bacterium]|nr:CBS domain-containing protein [Oscillospiraceae bacterium]MBQ8917797.1 CBS domain-containing protein [Oscillospiraceae bacterium]